MIVDDQDAGHAAPAPLAFGSRAAGSQCARRCRGRARSRPHSRRRAPRTRSCMPRHAKAHRRQRIDATAVVAHREHDGGVGCRRAWRGRDSHVDARGLRVADHVGQALLHAAIDREIDRIAIAALELCRRERRTRSADTARARSRTSSDRMSRSGTWPSAIGRSRLSMPRLIACRCSMMASSRARAPSCRPPRLRKRLRGARDRCRIGLEPEQARADLVVQVERGAPALVVLRRDQAAVETSDFPRAWLPALPRAH